MKKLIGILLAATVIVGLLCSVALADGDFSLSVSSGAAERGKDVTISLSISDNPGIGGITCGVSYDADALELKSIVGKIADGTWSNSIAADDPVIQWYNTAAYSSDGVIAELTFRVKDDAVLRPANVTVTFGEFDGVADTSGNALQNFTYTGGTITIAAGEHTHDWGEGVVTTAASCESAGVRTYTCSVCGEQKTEEIPAAGHKWDEGAVTTAASCESAGVKTYTCQNDASHTRTEELPATGHSWDDGAVTKQASCKETGVKTYTCKNDASHTKTEELAKTDHTWDEGVVTTEPTCKDEGVRTFTCTVCGETKTEPVPKTDDHELKKVEAKDATLTEKGNIEYWECTVCGRLFLDAEGKTETTKPEVEFPALYEEKVVLDEVTEEDAAILTEAATAAGYSDKNIELIEATLMVSFDNGRTWIEAAEADIPSGGAVVAFDYPAGTSAKNHDFVIYHKKADGTVETLTPTEGDKLTVKVTSLSPFAIAWKDAPKSSASGGTPGGSAPGRSPRTGDDAPIALWVGMLLLCGAGLVIMARKKVKA